MLRVIISLIALVFSLTACLPVAFVAGATAGGVVVSDQRSIKTVIKDRDIANTALNRLNADPEIYKQTHIIVSSYNKIVLLAGQAPTEALKQKVYNIVQSVPDIRRIYNEITVEPPLSNAAIASDSWLTTKVKSAMIAEKGLKSATIKVVTENNTVYLMGIVTASQGDVAADVARKVGGVQKVVKIFEYVQ